MIRHPHYYRMEAVKAAKAAKGATAAPKQPKEDDEQIIVVAWLTKNNYLHFHVPNGGRRSIWEGLKFKRMGVKAGVPDIVIPMARSGYHGLYGELKRQTGGKVSEAQKWWLEKLKAEGYYTFVANGAQEFIQHVKNYFEEGVSNEQRY